MIRTLGLLVLIAVLAVGVWWFRVGSRDSKSGVPDDPVQESHYVGGNRCVECHTPEHTAWQGSHHDLAMQVADENTVLADFDNSSFEFQGTRSSFFREGDDFVVRTVGADGALAEFRVSYVFGFDPLQQYLIEMDDGRLQALNICWDSRPATDGGQRWFHLYPDEEVTHEHIFHWTGRYFTWNHMCADCHSTDLRKNYDLDSNSYKTAWTDIDVSCEACHGPGSLHLEWAALEDEERAQDKRMGLVHLLRSRIVDWPIDPETGSARPQPERKDLTEIEACARCHSRRGLIATDPPVGKPLLDTHRVAFLTDLLYHADGQIEDEVYVYGSFVQSRMFHAGVTCSDCHDSHSGRVMVQGNELCARCHQPDRFDTPDHHHHEEGSTGASCVDCHMPETNYMVVDPRRDHSMRVPRPDLSVRLSPSPPNACTACHDHEDQDDSWAMTAFEEWWGKKDRDDRIVRAITAGRKGEAAAAGPLRAIVEDAEVPAITRATVVELLLQYPEAVSLGLLQSLAGDQEPMLRQAVAEVLVDLPPEVRAQVGGALLDDPVRLVRTAAARGLAVVSLDLPADRRDAYQEARDEFVAAQLATADIPESHLNLGSLYLDERAFAAAVREYQTAIRLDPEFLAAYVNLADLERARGNDEACEEWLRKAEGVEPENAAVTHSLGLVLIRRERTAEGVTALGRAAQFEPDNPRYGYVFAVALHDTGEPEQALEVLRGVMRRHPTDRGALQALIQYLALAGNNEEALFRARELLKLEPGNPDIQGLVRELQSRTP